MKEKIQLYGIDNGCTDIVVSLPSMPGPDETARVSGTSLQGGGKVATALTAASRLGTRTAIIGKCGSDGFGKFVRADFLRHSVDIENLVIEEGNTPYSVVIVEEQKGSRTILWNPGSLTRIEPEDLPVRELSSAPFIHLANPTPAAVEAARIVKKGGGEVSFDGDFVEEGIEELIPYIDHFIASLDFAASYTNNTMETERVRYHFLDYLVSRGVKYAALTMGKNGVVGKSSEGYELIPAYTVSVRDTTGAGDVFHGAYISAFAAGKGFRRALLSAAAASALKCMYPGGRAGIPNAEMLTAFMDRGEVIEGGRKERDRYYRQCFYNFGNAVTDR